MEQTVNGLAAGTVLRGQNFSYRIERVLGQGSFGITYLASIQIAGQLGKLDLKAYVAIKEFFMRDVNGREGTTVTSGSRQGLYADYKRKFVREARNLSQLEHPNIIKVLEAFEANNTVYYAMEYIDGGSLDNLIVSRGRLPESMAITLATQIGAALQKMHSEKMLHLDLKPGNVMMKQGEAVLIDFGLSKQFDTNGQPESSTIIGGGTPGYAPLEQNNYKPGEGFPATMDVYALGATLFKMVTGQRPPIASDILNDGFPSDDLNNVSHELSAVIEKAMSPMRKRRYQTVAEMLAALPQATYDEPTILDVSYSKPENTRPIIDGHEYVDLGLPSGLKWATCNLGAKTPKDYGKYFAWGETKAKDRYELGNCLTFNKRINEFAGNCEYDAARAKWGGRWRMPTKEEFEELCDNCDYQWTGDGAEFTSRINGAKIYLPAGGWRDGRGCKSHGSDGYYWSTSKSRDTSTAWHLHFDESGSYVHRFYLRFFGLSVRPVAE